VIAEYIRHAVHKESPAVESFRISAAGFVLMVMVLTMNALAIWLRYKMRKNIKW